jgi:hypothetical protein
MTKGCCPRWGGLRLHFVWAEDLGGEGRAGFGRPLSQAIGRILTRLISVERMADENDSATADQEGYDHAHERSSRSAIAAR